MRGFARQLVAHLKHKVDFLEQAGQNGRRTPSI
jgi:hypothetical protein